MCNLALSTAARNSDGPCGTHRSRLPHLAVAYEAFDAHNHSLGIFETQDAAGRSRRTRWRSISPEAARRGLRRCSAILRF
jgi:hypothetical protein